MYGSRQIARCFDCIQPRPSLKIDTKWIARQWGLLPRCSNDELRPRTPLVELFRCQGYPSQIGNAQEGCNFTNQFCGIDIVKHFYKTHGNISIPWMHGTEWRSTFLRSRDVTVLLSTKPHFAFSRHVFNTHVWFFADASIQWFQQLMRLDFAKRMCFLCPTHRQSDRSTDGWSSTQGADSAAA